MLSFGADHALSTIVAFDHLAWAGAVALAAIARLEFQFDQVRWAGVAGLIAIGAVLQLFVGLAVGLYRNRHPVGTHAEFRYLAVTVTIVGLTASFAVAPLLQAGDIEVPRSLGILGAPLALLMMTSARSTWRSMYDRSRRPDPQGKTRILVFGAGNAGKQIVRSMLHDPRSTYVPVGVLDDSARLKGRRIEGLEVLGGADVLGEAAEELDATMILLAIPTAPSVRVREIVQDAESAGLAVRVLPPTRDIVDGQVTVSDIREVTITDLLQRDQATLDVEAISGYITGRRVLVTGAGGSIGSELTRQVSRFAPSALFMLDRDESALLSLQLSLDGRGQMSGEDLLLADIRDGDRVRDVFESVQPDVVFHAAALKHVPLLQRHPYEGLLTNVIGTSNVLDAAVAVGVDAFVNISTDKAADPENVLGFTKRIAERLTAETDRRAPGRFLSVRFGNVLGSRGSVLHTFEEQIRGGGPVTVTHPEVTRYFMTVEEAVRLVIQAGAMGETGEVLVLDMGTPVRIVELAQQLISLAQRPVDIVFTGLRPGERLHEVLFSTDEVGVQRTHPQIFHSDVAPLRLEGLEVHPDADADDIVAFLRDAAFDDTPLSRIA